MAGFRKCCIETIKAKLTTEKGIFFPPERKCSKCVAPAHTDEGKSVDTYVECSSSQYIRCYIKTQITEGNTPLIPCLFSVAVGKHHDGNQRQLDQWEAKAETQGKNL